MQAAWPSLAQRKPTGLTFGDLVLDQQAQPVFERQAVHVGQSLLPLQHPGHATQPQFAQLGDQRIDLHEDVSA